MRPFTAVASLALALVAGRAEAKDITWRGFCAGILHFDRELGLLDLAAEPAKEKVHVSSADRIGSACSGFAMSATCAPSGA